MFAEHDACRCFYERTRNGDDNVAVTYTKKQIGKGITLNVITDPKFKTSGFRFYFVFPLTAEKASAYSLPAYLLEDTNSEYTDITSFNSRLAELYGAEVSTSIQRFGDERLTMFSASSIADRYALEGENISFELLKLICGCIFRPVLDENGVFPKKQFDLKLTEMIEDINSVINDKRNYALKRAGSLVYSGEPAGIPLKGEASEAAELTPQVVYKAYRDMLSIARVEIFYMGNALPDGCEEYIIKCFEGIDRHDICEPSYSPSPIKYEVCESSDVLDVTQNKMVMAFKYSGNFTDAATRLFSVMFGGSPTSLLFKNVREKLSLCYYCDSTRNKFKSTYYVDSGLEAVNTDAARKEILNQLEILRKGEFSDELLEQSKLFMKTSLRAVEDFPTSVAGWYFDRIIDSVVESPAGYAESVDAVTKQDIIDIANSLKLDTVYVLKGSE